MFCYHIVKPGDTVYRIALEYNIAPCLLIRLNKIVRPNDIRPGMKLIVPCRGDAKDAFQMELEDTNESLFHYGDMECMIGEDIVSAAGEEANVDMAEGMMGKAEPSMPVMPNGEYMIGEMMKFDRYTVKPGDTVYQIAKKYHTTMYHIIIANGLRPPYLIFPGQELIVPYTNEKTVIYTVKPGDTVYQIARAHSVPVENIIQYNYMDSQAHIYPGQQLMIKM